MHHPYHFSELPTVNTEENMPLFLNVVLFLRARKVHACQSQIGISVLDWLSMSIFKCGYSYIPPLHLVQACNGSYRGSDLL